MLVHIATYDEPSQTTTTLRGASRRRTLFPTTVRLVPKLDSISDSKAGARAPLVPGVRITLGTHVASSSVLRRHPHLGLLSQNAANCHGNPSDKLPDVFRGTLNLGRTLTKDREPGVRGPNPRKGLTRAVGTHKVHYQPCLSGSTASATMVFEGTAGGLKVGLSGQHSARRYISKSTLYLAHLLTTLVSSNPGRSRVPTLPRPSVAWTSVCKYAEYHQHLS